MRNPTSSPPDTQARWTFTDGLYVREDGHTRPISLTDFERCYGRGTLDVLMSNPREWIGVGAPTVTLIARVASRDYTIEFVDPDAAANAFIVEADDAVIRVSNADPISFLMQALDVAREQETAAVSAA